MFQTSVHSHVLDKYDCVCNMLIMDVEMQRALQLHFQSYACGNKHCDCTFTCATSTATVLHVTVTVTDYQKLYVCNKHCNCTSGHGHSHGLSKLYVCNKHCNCTSGHGHSHGLSKLYVCNKHCDCTLRSILSIFVDFLWRLN